MAGAGYRSEQECLTEGCDGIPFFGETLSPGLCDGCHVAHVEQLELAEREAAQRVEFAKVQRGLLPRGTVTWLGMIVWSSTTGYELEDGSWVSFDEIHGRPAAVSPLVVFS